MAKRERVLGGLVGAVLLAGCGAPGAVGQNSREGGHRTETSTGPEPASPLVTVDGEVMLSCGSSPGFAASAMAGGVTGLADEAEVAVALEALAAEAGIDAPRELQGSAIADAAWIVLGKTNQDGEELIVGLGGWSANGPGADGEYVRLDRVADGWRAGSWGTCNLAPVLAADVSWVDVAAPPEGLDPAATSLEVEVSERECTSGRNPEPFLHEPVVVQDNGTVTVYWTSDYSPKDATCPGNPSVRRVLPLRQPLGDRALLDGSTWPPRPVAGS